MLEESGFGATTSKVIRQRLDGDFRKQLPPKCGAVTLRLCCSGLLTPGMYTLGMGAVSLLVKSLLLHPLPTHILSARGESGRDREICCCGVLR